MSCNEIRKDYASGERPLTDINFLREIFKGHDARYCLSQMSSSVQGVAQGKGDVATVRCSVLAAVDTTQNGCKNLIYKIALVLPFLVTVETAYADGYSRPAPLVLLLLLHRKGQVSHGMARNQGFVKVMAKPKPGL